MSADQSDFFNEHLLIAPRKRAERAGAQETRQPAKRAIAKKSARKARSLCHEAGKERLYLEVDAVAARFAVSRATIWRWLKEDPDFPSPVQFGKKSTRWIVKELQAFETQKALARKGRK